LIHQRGTRVDDQEEGEGEDSIEDEQNVEEKIDEEDDNKINIPLFRKQSVKPKKSNSKKVAESDVHEEASNEKPKSSMQKRKTKK